MSPAYLSFFPEFTGSIAPDAHDLWFIFDQNRILTDESGNVPQSTTLQSIRENLAGILHLGRSLDHNSFAATVEPLPAMLPQGFGFTDLRLLFRSCDEHMKHLASRARELITWNEQSRFCGRCGTPTINKTVERAKECPQCGLVRFPRISPAVIVAVIKDNKILLARGKNSTMPFHSVLAGFVEAGESLEICVKREVLEEVGLEITDIRYFGSQPWPFPDSLMVAFTARHAAGEINIDKVELEHAAWYGPVDLPPIPPNGSVSRKLIDWFTSSNQA
jgi:NAD+ diphosphatase